MDKPPEELPAWPDCSQGPEPDKAIEDLRGLKLAQDQAETYFKSLLTVSGEPMSSANLPQTTRRDPAEAAQTLAAPVRRQDMTLLHVKPRLYLSAAPATYTERVLRRFPPGNRK